MKVLVKVALRWMAGIVKSVELRAYFQQSMCFCEKTRARAVLEKAGLRALWIGEMHFFQAVRCESWMASRAGGTLCATKRNDRAGWLDANPMRCYCGRDDRQGRHASSQAEC